MILADPDRIHWPELVQEGITARKQRDGAQWELGDLAGEVETIYGGHDLERYAEEIGIEYDALRQYQGVATAYENVTRVTNLSWTHHRVLASRPDRLDWLQRAEAEAWSIRQLAEEAARHQPTQTNPRVDAPQESNGVLPLEGLWPTPQYLLTNRADRYLQLVDDLRALCRQPQRLNGH